MHQAAISRGGVLIVRAVSVFVAEDLESLRFNGTPLLSTPRDESSRNFRCEGAVGGSATPHLHISYVQKRLYFVVVRFYQLSWTYTSHSPTSAFPIFSLIFLASMKIACRTTKAVKMMNRGPTTGGSLSMNG